MIESESCNESKSVSKDPICGMTVSQATALHADQDGETFYFCSAECQQKFLVTPSSATSADKSAEKPAKMSGGCCA